MFAALTVFILSLDQLTKLIAQKNLILNKTVPVIKGAFHFTLIHNRGAAFGIFRDQVPLFIVISIVVIILIFYNLNNIRNKKPSLYGISLCVISAGALGNLVDRIFYGYVIDFLDFRIWPVFNIADSAITAGAVLLGWSFLKSKVHNK